MAKFASYSPDATEWLKEKTGNSRIMCYSCIDPSNQGNSFFIVSYGPDVPRVAHVNFRDIRYNPSSFASLIEGLYQALNE